MKFQEIIIDHMVNKLIKLCQMELELDDLPKIKLLYQQPLDLPAFGYYDGEINVVVANRHPVDVMRTLAHELVHWKQHKSGMQLDGDDGSYIENQANALAGVVIRKFGKLYPELYSMED